MSDVLTFLVSFFLLCVSPGSPSPVAQQMTAMSISQDSGALDSERLEADDGEEESTSNSLGKCYRKPQPDLRAATEDSVETRVSVSLCRFFRSQSLWEKQRRLCLIAIKLLIKTRKRTAAFLAGRKWASPVRTIRTLHTRSPES